MKKCWSIKDDRKWLQRREGIHVPMKGREEGGGWWWRLGGWCLRRGGMSLWTI